MAAILIIDDDPDFRDSLSETLVDLGQTPCQRPQLGQGWPRWIRLTLTWYCSTSASRTAMA